MMYFPVLQLNPHFFTACLFFNTRLFLQGKQAKNLMNRATVDNAEHYFIVNTRRKLQHMRVIFPYNSKFRAVTRLN